MCKKTVVVLADLLQVEYRIGSVHSVADRPMKIIAKILSVPANSLNNL